MENKENDKHHAGDENLVTKIQRTIKRKKAI